MNNIENNHSALMQRLFWRLHFWAGILTAPIVLIAAVTGVLYIFSPQIEAWKYAKFDQAQTHGKALNLEQQIVSAKQSITNLSLRTIIPAYQDSETSVFVFGENKAKIRIPEKLKKMESSTINEHAEHGEQQITSTPSITPTSLKSPLQPTNKMSEQSHSNGSNMLVYVDPSSGQVQGVLAEKERFKEWSRKLHSTLLQGDSWRWIIELGACWLLVLMLSGIYLWWPRNQAGWRNIFIYPNSGQSRVNWRYLHSVFSFVLSILTITIILTGITWSKYAGENFKIMQNRIGQQAPRPLQNLQSSPIKDQAPLTAQEIFNIAKAKAPAIRIQMTPPKNDIGIWRIENYDRNQPEKRFVFILDAYTGAVLFQSGWEQFPMLARATAVGIPFHRGEFGWWNQALLLLVGMSVIFSVISGYVMWLKRRKAGHISAPKIEVRHVTALPWWMYIIAATLAYALPLFGISLLIFVGLEVISLFLQKNLCDEK